MKPAVALLAVATLFTAPSAAFAWERIATQEQLIERIADRTQTGNGNTWVYHADGRITGTWSGQPMAGRWEWHQGFFCRNVRVGTNPESGTDCQRIEIRGNEVRITRDQGRGDSAIANIQ